MTDNSLRNSWPQFTGKEELPLNTFVKSHPGDKPDSDTASVRGWEEIKTQERLDAIIAQQAALKL